MAAGKGRDAIGRRNAGALARRGTVCCGGAHCAMHAGAEWVGEDGCQEMKEIGSSAKILRADGAGRGRRRNEGGGHIGSKRYQGQWRR